MKYAGLCFLVVSQCLIMVFSVVPSVPLKNSAVPGLIMPATGLGTGGYGMNPSVGYNGYPECWAERQFPDKKIGCGKYTKKALNEWIQVGGRRIDAGDNYGNEIEIGEVIKTSSVPRSELFVLTKVGILCPFGYNETLKCFTGVVSDLQLEYLDALLIHYPHPFNQNSEDPYCKPTSKLYNLTMCRLQTWKALVHIFEAGGAKAIGVSNYEIEHLEEIVSSGLPLPSINQCHFHPYGGSAQMPAVKYCQAHDIVFLGYSPLGVPDYHKYPGPDMHPTVLEDPVVLSIAAAHKKSPAQVIQAWLWSLGIPANPRCQNLTHMIENLNYFDIVITPEESNKLMGLHQDTCAEDPTWYECAKV